MKKLNLVALLLFAGTAGNLHGQSLRGGGCSDLYGAGTTRAATNEVADQSESKVHLVSTGGDSAVYPVGLFRKGGCSNGSCLSHLGHHAGGQYGVGQYGAAVGSVYSQAPAVNYYQAPAVNYYQAPAASYYQGPVAAPAPSYYQAPAGISSGCSSCGNAVIAYGNTIQGNVASGAVVVQTEQRSLMDCGPVNSYKVVLEPKYFTETRAVPVTEYQNETRYRTRTVARTVPVETQDYKTITVMVPRSETKTVEYTVLVPKTSEKTVEVIDTVPVWTEVAEQYTVKVPQVVDVPEEYKVRVAQLVDQEFTYTVQVPQALTETRLQSVTNAIPVTKTRIVQTSQPVTRMQSVTKDYGHWEDRIEEVTVAAPASVVSNSAPVCSTPAYSAPTYSAPAVYASPVAYAAPSYSSGAGQCGAGAGHGCRLFRRGGCGSGCGHIGHCGCGRAAGCGSGASCSVAGGCGVGQAVYAQPAGQAYGAQVYSAPTYSAPACAPAYSESVQYSAPTTQMVTRRVWVPNVVTEEVAVVENVSQSQEVAYTVFEQQTEQIPFESTYLVYRPETRTGTRKVVNYVEESRTRNRKVVQYNDETRTRTLKKLSYKQETRTETIPVVSYATEKRTKEVSFSFNVPETKVEPFTSTRFETVNEEVSEEYTVSVPVSTTKEVQVQVCRMVPKLVPVTIYPCAEAQQAGGCANGCGGSPTLAPAVPTAGCSGCANGCQGCR